LPLLMAMILGIVMYLIVFNLNLLRSGFRRVFSILADFLVRQMVAEGRSTETRRDWPSKAKRFEVYPHPDKNSRPSNRWLLYYALRLLFRPISQLFMKSFARINRARINRARRRAMDDIVVREPISRERSIVESSSFPQGEPVTSYDSRAAWLLLPAFA
jgi:hypothetical protein